MNFWEIIGFFFWSYIFISYLMVLFWIIGDLFRNRNMNGWLKAVWILCLLVVPFLTSLVYLIVCGHGMSERQAASVNRSISETEQYIRSVSSSSPVEDIVKAKSLLDAGAINQSEFDALKARSISGQHHPTAV
ncbi:MULTISPECIES: SHOCT domain-containing protein [unclassified Arthrobacter]|uniref:SHOCT domain-containing protein n=1 Tax=unclassified Arthrobacter TaxID=235627 RepID=UPI000CE3E57F|nr:MULTISPECIES: SHOCT domain-containing protein [unclassified Arthrobacter]